MFEEKSIEIENGKNLQLDRLVFFCDAVVAIAITLLALNLKTDYSPLSHFKLSDFVIEWKSFLAFLLSFINIASFWKTHHSIFSIAKKIDDKLIWMNLYWLLFIILLPASTSIVSKYFYDTSAQILYSSNILFITFLQNRIAKYSLTKIELNEQKGAKKGFTLKLLFNLDLLNALLGVIFSFINPTIAFIILFTKLPMIFMSIFYFKINERKKTYSSIRKTTKKIN